MNGRNDKCKRLLRSAVPAFMIFTATPGSAAQAHYPSAEQVASSFVIAVARNDHETMSVLLGDDYPELLPLDQIGDSDVDRFLQAWIRYHTLLPSNEVTRMLAVGENGWTLPIPIVREAEGWRFDTQAGREIMRIRRIGRNELAAMQAALAYVDAQTEYAQVDHDGDGVLEYAQRFISSAGRQDGLYWEPASGEAESPLGSLFAENTPDKAYHGYYYRILTAQGEHATGGHVDYMLEGNMVGGFALVAWPAIYGETGVISFMTSMDGVVYETDLGPDGGAVASSMSVFDPGRPWEQVSPVFTDPD